MTFAEQAVPAEALCDFCKKRLGKKITLFRVEENIDYFCCQDCAKTAEQLQTELTIISRCQDAARRCTLHRIASRMYELDCTPAQVRRALRHGVGMGKHLSMIVEWLWNRYPAYVGAYIAFGSDKKKAMAERDQVFGRRSRPVRKGSTSGGKNTRSTSTNVSNEVEARFGGPISPKDVTHIAEYVDPDDGLDLPSLTACCRLVTNSKMVVGEDEVPTCPECKNERDYLVKYDPEYPSYDPQLTEETNQ